MNPLSKQTLTSHFLPALMIAAMLAGCAGHKVQDKPAQAESGKESAEGYLPTSALPDSYHLLPPPPAADSAAFALDQKFSKNSLVLRDTPAWALAKLDADYSFPQGADTFSCALNAPVTKQDTPHLYTLLRRSVNDAKESAKAAKERYHRLRPFLINNEPICTPEDRPKLEKSGSYPSSHNAIGMAWALILAEVSPDQANAILARGQAYGMSRIVCNVHWYSDTLQGRFLGAYTVALLHSDANFLKDVEAAKAELKAVRAKGLKPTRDCQAEKAGMDLQQSLYR